ncbi:hypothetical protein [Actinomadura rupiterrae]|uniref:hypothetical protein n=1 Tax=Actinomadura rupiterrae TaxID=559627 RepID=UPI0020A48541|nr:hypothetical protein [Actinomadura rupiterrae]MCP2341338.1 hypothetical protein [Actinomadura rupiterrae]
MSFVLWYKVEIAAADAPGGGPPGLPLTVSNDALSGSPVVDAEITVSMADGARADAFEVSLVSLPSEVTALLRDAHAALPLNATVHLGFFGDPAIRSDAARVLVGRIMSVTYSVGADGLSRTVLGGQEEGGYLLRSTPAEQVLEPGTPAVELAAALAVAAGVTLADGSTLPDGGDAGLAVRAGSALDALGALAERADTALVVRDRRVHLGAAVGSPTDPAPVALDPDTNLVSLSSSTVEDTAARVSFPAGDLARPPVRTTVDATVLGHPRFRVGQLATTNNLSGVPSGPLRVTRAVHRFLLDGGYTTELQLVASGPGDRVRVADGALAVADRLRDAVGRDRDNHPAVDVGQVTSYTSGVDGGPAAALHYGQVSQAGASATGEVGTAVELRGKPVASAFAFDRTGLVTPVYPGMRALLAHNRGEVDDAVVAGFVWADGQRRPPSQPGDHWLALPTGLDEDGLPVGKGVNDLTDASGHRVVQAAGLRLAVGADALPEVGVRPDPPTDDALTIAHQSGTTITVDSQGAITISTDDKPVTLTNGSVSVTLDGSSVAVS